MPLTYNKIDWTENTAITAPNLDNMDTGIDEVVAHSNSNESDITTNESDISNIEDGTTVVPNADIANVLASGLSSLDIEIGDGVVDESSTRTQALEKTYEKVLIVTESSRLKVGDDVDPSKNAPIVYENINEFYLENIGDPSKRYAYIAVNITN